MIKCNVSCCAVVSRSASLKEGKNGEKFIAFSVKYPVTGRDGEKKELEISVSMDGGKTVAASITTGRRVNIVGTMYMKKRDGKLYFNIRATEGVDITKSTEADRMEGTVDFRGKIGKKGVEVKKDKNDKEFKTFSAFSSDKNGEKVDFTWMRFLYFNPKDGEDFLKESAYIEAQGELQLGVFKDEITLDCRLSEVKPWEMQTAQQ